MTDDVTGDGIAASAPAQLAEKAALGWPAMALLAVLAGIFIAFGSIAFLVVQAGEVTGAVQLLSGAAFSVGLILTVVTGAELFTGNTMFVLPLANRRIGPGRMLAAWTCAWGGNLIGSLLVATLFVAAGGGDGVGGLVTTAAVEVAQAKVDKSAAALLASGVLANMLVCLAVWMAMGAQSITAKIVAIVPPVTVFVAAGFEHSIANQSLLPIGWMLQRGDTIPIAGIVRNLAFSTIGNIVGGAGVAMALHAAHRPRD